MRTWHLPLIAERTMIGAPLTILGVSVLLARLPLFDSWSFLGLLFLLGGATCIIDEMLLRPLRS